VIASNSDGIWNDEGVSLKIVINKPFWKEWWFILFLIIIGLLVIFLTIKLRTNALAKRAQELECQVEERTKKLALKSKQLENELGRRTYFSKALVHELKTPLTAMVAASSLLSTELKDEPYKSLSRHLHEGANDLNGRINELFLLAKGELGLLTVEKKTADITKLLSDVIEISKHEAHIKGQRIIFRNPAPLPLIELDEGRIRQVLFNILDNAIKFSPKDSDIYVEAKIRSADIIISIKDSGTGMEKEELSGIFQSYNNKDRYKGNLNGLGLGLCLSKMFIDLHGGRIWAESEKGEGSIFTFSIPLTTLNDR
jgi:signal transduction histidine kinase